MHNGDRVLRKNKRARDGACKVRSSGRGGHRGKRNPGNNALDERLHLNGTCLGSSEDLLVSGRDTSVSGCTGVCVQSEEGYSASVDRKRGRKRGERMNSPALISDEA